MAPGGKTPTRGHRNDRGRKAAAGAAAAEEAAARKKKIAAEEAAAHKIAIDKVIANISPEDMKELVDKYNVKYGEKVALVSAKPRRNGKRQRVARQAGGVSGRRDVPTLV